MSNKENINKIKVLKTELSEKYNINTDRDLIKQLGIKEEDRCKLFAWIDYQSAYKYRDGWVDGIESYKEAINEINI